MRLLQAHLLSVCVYRRRRHLATVWASQNNTCMGSWVPAPNLSSRTVSIFLANIFVIGGCFYFQIEAIQSWCVLYTIVFLLKLGKNRESKGGGLYIFNWRLKLFIFVSKIIDNGPDLLQLYENVTGVRFFWDTVYIVLCLRCYNHHHRNAIHTSCWIHEFPVTFTSLQVLNTSRR